jgi:hypothetical protein
MISQYNLLGSLGNVSSNLDIGISDIDFSNIGMEVDVDIGMKRFSPTFFVPISE